MFEVPTLPLFFMNNSEKNMLKPFRSSASKMGAKLCATSYIWHDPYLPLSILMTLQAGSTIASVQPNISLTVYCPEQNSES